MSIFSGDWKEYWNDMKMEEAIILMSFVTTLENHQLRRAVHLKSYWIGLMTYTPNFRRDA